MTESFRFSAADVATWRREGVAQIQSFFTPEEVALVVADFEKVFGKSAGAEEGLDHKSGGEVGRFHPAQFKTLEALPLDCSPALNLIGVHPALVAFARAALGTEAVHLYQCQAWAKFTGDADYDQPFHCDFVNHTLTAPSEDAEKNCVTILCYFTDVTDAHGAMRYVTRPDSLKVAGPEATLNFDPAFQADMQARLRTVERTSAGPAGTINPYSIDIFHRGANLTAPGGRRYAVMSCFKRAGDEAIGFHAWQFHHTRPWRIIFDHASPEQLACFGVPSPGHPFWTETTLKRAQARYPNWNLDPWRAALAA
ncbi:MAG TPA: phytanoyl-CoA dioxygenase family protein [Caulobacteraceae bacterium]|jgi:hypothetical protein